MKWTACLVTLAALTACARDASGPGEFDDLPEAGMAGTDAGRTEDAGVRDSGSTPSDDDADEPETTDACSGRCEAAVEPSSCDDGPVPGSSIDLDGVTVSGVKVSGGGNTAEVEAGASVMVTAEFEVSGDSCVTLPIPIPVAVAVRLGFEEGPAACSDTSFCSLMGKVSVSITAPTQPGTYGIYAATASNLELTTCTQPFDAVPPESARIATICVK